MDRPDDSAADDRSGSYGAMPRVAFLCTFATSLIFFNLWHGSLHPWDEGWYGEIAREVVVENLGWLTLHYNWAPFIEKPPLFMWMVAATFEVTGVSEFGLRFWAAAAAVGSVILLYFVARRLLGSNQLAFMSSLALLGFGVFYRQSRMGMTDAPLMFLILLGIFCFLAGREKRGYLLCVGPVIGLAFMIKSFAAFQLPIILILFALMCGELRMLWDRRFILGLLLGIALCLPWHVHQYLSHGPLFLKEYFLSTIVARSVELLPGHPSRDFSYYFRIILEDIPLGAVQVAVIPFFVFLTIKEKDREKKCGQMLAAIAVFVVLGLFTAVKTKMRWYILPVYPFLSMATAATAGHVLHLVEGRKRQAVTSLLLCILIITPLVRLGLDKKLRSLDYSPQVKQICRETKRVTSKGDPLLLYNVKASTTALFYCERNIVVVSKEKLVEQTKSPHPAIWMMSKDDELYEELKNNGNGFGLSVLSETKDFVLMRKSGGTGIAR